MRDAEKYVETDIEKRERQKERKRKKETVKMNTHKKKVYSLFAPAHHTVPSMSKKHVASAPLAMERTGPGISTYI